jgi:hypothetical protein
MTPTEAFLQRLTEHIQAQRQRMDPSKANNPVEAAKFLVGAFLAPSRMALDTVGLGLEGTHKLGNYAAGETGLGISAVQAAIGDPNHPATIAAKQALALGPAHPQAALDTLRNSGDPLSSWLYGGLAMAYDPANIIPLPLGHARQAENVAAQAARKVARATPSEEFLNATAQALRDSTQAARAKVAEALPQQTIPIAPSADVATALAQLTAKEPIDAVLQRGDAAFQMAINPPRPSGAVDEAQRYLADARQAYRDASVARDKAVRPVARDILGPALRRGDIKALRENPTPEYLAAVEEAKNNALKPGPGYPRRGQTYADYLQPYRDYLNRVRTEEDNALAELRGKLTATQPAPITPAQAALLSQPADTAPNALSELNARFNKLPGGPEAPGGPVLQPGEVLDPGTGQAVPTTAQPAALEPDVTLPPPPLDPGATLAPGTVGKSAEGRARTLFEQMMTDLGPTDDPVAFTAKLRVAQRHLAGLGYDMMDENAKLPFANGPVFTPEEAANAMAIKFGRPLPHPDYVRPKDVATEAKAIASPTVALDGSVPQQEPGYMGHMWDFIKTALAGNRGLPATTAPLEPEQAQSYLAAMRGVAGAAIKGGKAEMAAANARPWQKFSLKGLASVWAGVNVETPKNALILDPVFTRWVLSNEGIKKRYIMQQEKVLAYRLQVGEQNPLALLGNAGDWLQMLGKGVGDESTMKLYARAAAAKAPEDAAKLTAQAEEAQYRWMKTQLGTSGFDLEAENAANLSDLNTMQQALYGLATQLASPTRAVTGLLTAPANLLIPFRSKAFRIVNNVTHTAARVAAFEDAFLPFLQNSAKDLLQRAAAEGKDVSLLQGRGFARAGEQLATDGFFTPKEVTSMLGERYGAEWGRMVQQAFETGFDNSKRILGNYQLGGTLGKAESLVRKFVPFMSWSWRAYPRVAKYALAHPALSVALLHLYAADRAQAEAEGRPAYQVGTVAINKDTPLVGLLASVFTPEQEATVRLNPLSLFSPVSGELAGLGMDTGNPPENVYQQATQGLAVAGGSFNPLIQTAAYLTGADYKAPGNASRYAPIDQYLGNQTGLEVPTIQGPLRAARKAITGALPAGAQPDTYDPVEAKAKELVFELTGKPLEDAANKQYALDIQQKTGIYKVAEQDYLQGGALRAAANAVSPASLTTTTATTEQRRAAGQPPFSYDDIKLAQQQNLPALVKAMNAANDAFYAQNPAAAVNRNAPLTAQDKQDPRLTAWEAQHATLQRLAPKSYALALRDYKATIGIR